MREMLSERQLQAAALAAEIQRMGAFVTSPMPLDDYAKLRFQVLDTNRDAVIEKLSSWDWSPGLLSTFPRVTTKGFEPASLYEIDLPRSRQPIADNKIHGEFARPEKTSAEVEALERYLGWPPKPEKRRR